MDKRKRGYGLAIAAAAVLTAIGLTGPASLPARAAPVFITTWVNAFTDTGATSVNPKCLGVLNGDMTNGTPVVTWACNGHPDQTWESTGAPGNSAQTTIRNSVNPNKCLTVNGGGTSDGTILVIWDCNGSPDQLWGFTPWFAMLRGLPNGCFTASSQNAAPKVLGALGGNPTDGTPVVVWDPLITGFGDHLDQAWCPR